jgi:hydrogenase maturation protease
MSSSVLCIGVGNEFRGDDAVGLIAARMLQARRLPGLRVIEQSGEGAALMAAWSGATAVFLVDAVSSGAAPGTIYRLDARSLPIPAEFFHYSTHAFSVAEAVEMARALDELPPSLVVYGIEGANFGLGIGLSPAVEAALPALVEQMAAEILHP